MNNSTSLQVLRDSHLYNEDLGFTDSERRLVNFCKSTFLRLWCYPNVFAKNQGIGSHAELCDVTVVFNKSIILFSDKAILFNSDKELGVAWDRWYRKAVSKSAEQLRGAHHQLTSLSDKLYLDAACTQPFPVPVDARSFDIHLVAVARGATAACKAHFGGTGSGSLIQMNFEPEAGEDEAELDKDERRVFRVVTERGASPFVHVFDADSLELVLKELDTTADFVAYLGSRKALLLGPADVVACGEEELLALFLRGISDLDLRQGANRRNPTDLLVYGDASWPKLQADPAFQAYRRRMKKSYWVDDVINGFIKDGGPSVGDALMDARYLQTGLIKFASTSRRTRLTIYEHYEEVARLAFAEDDARVRTFIAPEAPDTAFVIMIEREGGPRSPETAAEDLLAWCFAAKPRLPQVSHIVGLLFWRRPGTLTMAGAHITYTSAETWGEEQEAHSRTALSWLTRRQGRLAELPPAEGFKPLSAMRTSPRRDSEKRKKRDKKAAAASRKRNRLK